jgi:hypothetical protein
MMRAGISRVVVEIIILVIAVALALLIFSPISGYIFGSLGRTATVGGAAQVQILNAKVSSTSPQLVVDVKNLGPGTVKCAGTSCGSTDFKIYIDGVAADINSFSGDDTNQGYWDKDEVFTLTCNSLPTGVSDGNKQHNIVVYGPGGTQSQYLYYPPPS